MFLKKLGKRGVAMTEYAILLAFVAAVAGSFTSDNGLASSIKDAVGKAENAINLAMGKEQSKLAVKENAKEYEDVLNKLFNEVVALTPEGVDPYCIKMKLQNDGTYSLYYSYKPEGGSNTIREVSGVELPSLKEYGYNLSGDNFFYFNEDDSLNKGWGNGPTRIMLRPEGEKNPVAWLAYDETEQKFFNNGKYFANNEEINN